MWEYYDCGKYWKFYNLIDHVKFCNNPISSIASLKCSIHLLLILIACFFLLTINKGVLIECNNYSTII